MRTEQELIRSVFSNDRGRELLEVWDDMFNKSVSYHPDNSPEQTAFREGQRAFFLAILLTLEDNHE